MTHLCFIFDLPSTIEKKKDIYYEYELRNVGAVVFCIFATVRRKELLIFLTSLRGF
jgi:hypothetical protein